MNVLYLDSIAKTPTAETYRYYNGLYDALNRDNNCFLYGKTIRSIREVLSLCPFKPDVIVFGLGWNSFSEIEGLSDIQTPTIFFVFKPQVNLEDKLGFCVKHKIRLLLSSIPDYSDYERKTGIETRKFCYAVDEHMFFPRGKKIYDIGFSGALHDNQLYQKDAFSTFNIRSRIQKILSQENSLSTILNGSDSVAPRIKNYDQYANLMSESRAWFATPAAFGDITPRYFEIPMSGTVLLCSAIPVSYQDIFRDGDNCVEFKNDLSDFRDRLYYALQNWESISTKAQTEFAKKHTWSARAEELVEIVNKMGNSHASK